MSEAPVRVLVDARVLGGQGGVGTFISGLARGFRELADPAIDLSFVVFEGHDDWLAPHLPPAARRVRVAAPEEGSRSLADHATQLLMRWPVVHRTLQPLYHRLRGSAPAPVPSALPPAPAPVSADSADVMHFTHQSGFAIALPSIYHPHDLQHVHLPELFSDEVKALRDAMYRPMCEQASVVAVASTWVRDDVIRELDVDPAKVHVVPLAPPDWEEADEAALPRELELPAGHYVFYPAVGWPHKNHARLLDAIAKLRDSGKPVPLVLTGGPREQADALRRGVERRGLAGQVWVLGVVSNEVLHALYRNARAVVIPTLFEAGSFPMWEAFKAGVPVASSSVTSLPAQAGDAAVIFNPADAADIALAIERVTSDVELRERLVAAGTARVASVSWRRTAAQFAALYRLIAGRQLTDDDRALLAADPPY